MPPDRRGDKEKEECASVFARRRYMRNSPHRFPEATKSPLVSPLTAKAFTSSSKGTTRSAAPPLLASHTRKVLRLPLASRMSPVAGSAKAVSA